MIYNKKGKKWIYYLHVYEITKRKRKRLIRKDFVNLRVYGVDILKYAILGLGNLDNKEIKYTDVIYTDIENIVIPKDKDIFQLIEGKNLSYVKMPKADYTEYDFEGVHLYNTLFPTNSFINPQKDIFQKVYSKNISYSALPTGDYSCVNFSDVEVRGITLNKESLLPNEEKFLQGLKYKSISKAKIYNGVYDKWNLDGVDIEYVTFGEGVEFPRSYNLLRSTRNSSIRGCTFIKKDLSSYDFRDLNVTECTFIKCTFPKNYDWAQVIKDKNISNCSFVDCNLETISLKEVNISGCKFKGNTKINIHENLFQEVYKKRVTEVTLPKGDYSKCNFKDVDLSYSSFTYYSLFPLKYNVFNDMKRYSHIRLPRNAMHNIHLYGLDKYDLHNIKNIKNNRKKNLPMNILIYLKTEFKTEE